MTYISHFFHAANALKKVKITLDSNRVLLGDTLTLNCSGETKFNGRIAFEWLIPVSAMNSTYKHTNLQRH